MTTRDGECVEWERVGSEEGSRFTGGHQSEQENYSVSVAVVAPEWSHRQNTREEKKKKEKTKVGCYVLGGT